MYKQYICRKKYACIHMCMYVHINMCLRMYVCIFMCMYNVNYVHLFCISFYIRTWPN